MLKASRRNPSWNLEIKLLIKKKIMNMFVIFTVLSVLLHEIIWLANSDY